MGCSVLCKFDKEKEEIKSEVNKNFFDENVQNEEKLSYKDINEENKIQNNNEPKPILLSVNKTKNKESNNNILNQSPKEQKLTNFTSKIQDIHQIKEGKNGILPEDEEMLKKTFKDHFLFKNKSSEVISSIIKELKIKVYEKDITLFKKGSDGSEFFIIKNGKILIHTEYGDKYLKEGDTFGELALIQNGKRTATAVTIERSEFFVLNK